MTMMFHRSASRIAYSSISTFAVASGTWMTGCGPSGVGSYPSSRQQIVEVTSKQDSVDQIKNRRKPGKNVRGPKSIKTKIFTSEDATPQ